MTVLVARERGEMVRKAEVDAVAETRELFSSHGLKTTAARLAVMHWLQKAKSPATHAEVAASLVPLGFDKATVLRNLTDLVEAGLVSRKELGDHVWRFELRRNDQNHDNDHPHFLCLDCGEVSCLSDVHVTIEPNGPEHAAGADRNSPSPASRLKITEILLKGHCVRCQRAT